MQLEGGGKMNKEYFRILFAQMKLTLDYDENKEFLIEDSFYFEQMNRVLEYLNNIDYDVVVFPELSYHERYEEYFLKASKNRIIVFGSLYVGNENYTVVYQNEKKIIVKKVFSCCVEPSIRHQENMNIRDFFKEELKKHVFKLKGKKFIVLNCAEYYKVAYLIARDEHINKNLFGFLVPCANNKNEVFFSESVALHNHNDSVYSFVVNSISTYKEEPYSVGGSYIFGRLSSFERMCGSKNNSVCSTNICLLDDDCYIVDGLYLYGASSNFYRSDDYKHTPKNLIIKKIGEI